jgi:hypothetical protein
VSTLIPKDGYYLCNVLLDTGGEVSRYVQVADGKVVAKGGQELLAEACSDFYEIGTLNYTCVFPAQAALELESLRSEVTRLRQWIAGLDEIDRNPGPDRKWADVSSWIPSGQTLFMGPPPPPVI